MMLGDISLAIALFMRDMEREDPSVMVFEMPPTVCHMVSTVVLKSPRERPGGDYMSRESQLRSSNVHSGRKGSVSKAPRRW